MTALLTMILAAAAVTAPAPAHTEHWLMELSTGGAYVTDRSFDVASRTDALPKGDLRLGLAPGWLNRHLELDLGLELDGNSTSTFETWRTGFRSVGLQLGLRYRQPLGAHFSVYGRLAGLLDFDTLQLSTGDDSLALSQTLLSPGAQLGAGVEVIVASWDRGRFGFNLEVGYALHFAPAHFDGLKPDLDESADPAPVAFASVDAGKVDVSGIRWRLGAVLHF